MTENFKCVEVGKDCKWTTYAVTEPERMMEIYQHAKHKHNIQEISEYFEI